MELIQQATTYLHAQHDQDVLLFKIINVNKRSIYTLKCVNTNSIFQADIAKITSDLDILYGLHPLQACFIGIEYAKYIKQNITDEKFSFNKVRPMNTDHSKWKIQYQNREGDICYTDTCSNKQFSMCPKKIVASEKIIRDFDPAQAFYIGICAGFKINNYHTLNKSNQMA